MTSVIHRERVGDASGVINQELDWLGGNCAREYAVVTDYFSARATTEQLGPDTCASWEQYIDQGAIALLREDGLCSEDAAAPVADDQPGGGIPWSDAAAHAGTTQRVCGPLVSVRGSSDDVFLNLGRDYPDPDRFTIVIWDIGGVEPIRLGTTVCTSGQIVLYEGVAQIQLRSPSAVELYG